MKFSQSRDRQGAGRYEQKMFIDRTPRCMT